MALEQAGLEWENKGLNSFLDGIGKANSGMEGISNATKGVSNTFKDANGRLRDADGKFVSAGDSAFGASGKFDILGSVITGVTSSVTTLAMDALGNLSSAMAGLITDSIDVATDFQSSMASLTIAAGSTGKSFEELQEISLAVGGDTRLIGVSASGAAEAMTGLFKAGLSLEEVLGNTNAYMEEGAQLGGALRASIDLAAATSLDMVDASDLAAVVLSTFGQEAQDAGISVDTFIVGAMNTLVKAADASVAEVEGLSEALKYAGPTAASLGVSLYDTSTALAVLSTAGIQGSSAGTGLNRMLLDLTKTTPNALDALDELGISTFDAEGNFKPLVEIIGQFQVALEGATDAEKQEYLQAIFTSQGQQAMTVLLEKGVEGWDGMTTAIDNATGIQEQAAVKSETLQAKQEALQGVIETLQIKIGNALLPALTDLTVIFSNIVEQYGPDIENAFKAVGSVFGDLVKGFADFVTNPPPFMQKVSEFAGGIGDAIIEAGKIFGLFEEQEPEKKIEPLIQSVSEFAEIMTGADLPDFEAPIRHVAVLRDTSAELVAVYEDPNMPNYGKAISDDADKGMSGLEKFKDWFDETFPFVQAGFKTLGEIIGGIGEVFKEVLSDDVTSAFEELKDAFAELGISGETVKLILGAIGYIIGGVIVTAIGLVVGAIRGLIKMFSAQTKTILNIKDAILGIIEGIALAWMGFVEFIRKVFQKDFKGAFEELKKILNANIKVLVNFAKLLISIITYPLRFILAFIKGFVTGVWDFFKGLYDKLVGHSLIPDMMDKIWSVITGVLTAIGDFISRSLEVIKLVFWRVFTAIKDTVSEKITWISDAIKSFIDTVKSKWEEFTTTLKDKWNTFWANIKEKVSNIVYEIKSTIEQWVEDIKFKWEGFVTAIKEKWSLFWDAIKQKVADIVEIIKDKIETFKENIKTAWDNLTGTLKEKWKTFWEELPEKIKTIWEDVKTKIGEGIESIKTWFEENKEKVIEIGKTLIDKIKAGLIERWTLITNTIGEKVSELKQAFQEGTLLQKLKDTAGNIINGIKTGLSEKFSGITESFTDFFEKLRWKRDVLWSKIKAIGSVIINAIKEGITEKASQFLDWLVNTLLGEETETETVQKQRTQTTAAAKPQPVAIEIISQQAIIDLFQGLISQITASFPDMTGLSIPTGATSSSPKKPAILRNTNVSNSKSVEITFPMTQQSRTDDQIYFDVVTALRAARI